MATESLLESEEAPPPPPPPLLVATTDTDDNMWHDDGSPCEDSKEELVEGFDLDREWRKRHNQFHARDGLTAGKEASAQEGFNVGFKQSVLAGYNWGLVRGISSALAFLSDGLKERLVETIESKEKLQMLYTSVHAISTNDALRLFHDETIARKSKENCLAEGSSSSAVIPGESSSCNQLRSYSVELESLLQSSSIQVHSAVCEMIGSHGLQADPR